MKARKLVDPLALFHPLHSSNVCTQHPIPHARKLIHFRNMPKPAELKKGLIVVLENATLQTVKMGDEYQLLNCDDHITFMKKRKRDPSEMRPDITHQV